MTAAVPDVVVVGRVGRDVVLLVDEVPGPGGSARSRERREMLGGKGANQAVALEQLGVHAAIVGVTGDDGPAGWLLDAAAGDGMDTSALVTRSGCPTGLIVSLVDSTGSWRYVEDLPDRTFVQRPDVDAAAPLIRSAALTSLQMQEPADTLLAAATVAKEAGRTVVADGVPEEGADTDELLAKVDVLRADAHEAELLTGRSVESVEEAVGAGRALMDRGPGMVVLAAGARGDVAVWRQGHVAVPHLAGDVVDTTGGGDAMVAGLIAAMLRHPDDPVLAVTLGGCASAEVVGRLGGRPHLEGPRLWAEAHRRSDELRGRMVAG